MKTSKVFVLAVLLIAGNSVTAQSILRVSLTELPKTDISTGELKITIKSTGKGAWAQGPTYATIEVQNTGKNPNIFDPQRLSFLDVDQHQLDVLFVGSTINSNMSEIDRGAPRDLLIIGGATSNQVYFLNGLLRFPARLYYKGAFLAELTK